MLCHIPKNMAVIAILHSDSHLHPRAMHSDSHLHPRAIHSDSHLHPHVIFVAVFFFSVCLK